MKTRRLTGISLFILFLVSFALAAPLQKEVYVLDFENKTADPKLDWLEKSLIDMIFQDKLRLPDLLLHPGYTVSEVIAFNQQDMRNLKKNQFVLLGSVYPSSGTGDVLIHMSAVSINTWKNVSESSFTAVLSDTREIKNQLIEHMGKLFNVQTLSLDFYVSETASDKGRIDTETLNAARKELADLIKDFGVPAEKEASTPQYKPDNENRYVTRRITTRKMDHTEAMARLELDRSQLERTQLAVYELLQNPYLIEINEPTISTLPYRPRLGRIRFEISFQILPALFQEITEVLPFKPVYSISDSYEFMTFNAMYNDIPFQLRRDIQLGNYRTIPVIQITDRQGRPVHTFIDGQYLNVNEIRETDTITLKSDFKQLLIMTASNVDIQLYLKQVPYVGVYEIELPISVLENLYEIRVELVPVNELYERY
jgi:hypothetical protein